MSFRRFRASNGGGPAVVEAPAPVELDQASLESLSRVFRLPPVFRELGRTAWALVGVILLLVGFVWLLGTTAPIVGPLIIALIVAIVVAPVVNRLAPHTTRAGAAAIVLVGGVVIAVCILLLVISGITSQMDAIREQASASGDKLATKLHDAGLSTASSQDIVKNLGTSLPKILDTLVHGLISGIAGIATIAFGLSLTALCFFFLLQSGPSIRRWLEEHSGLPYPVARTVTQGVMTSMRGYFRGVTIVALFNAVVVFLGALVLGVPLKGTIAIVTFVTAYVPYIGAFIAGAFAVIIALGAKGTTTAILMLVIVLLANGLLQNIVQPFAMGAALNLNPLAVLIVTIGAGCLFGTIGLILAAPLTSAAVHITRDLSRARAAAVAVQNARAP
jgi:predicted PurR-regulated permease PerM